MTLTDHFDLAEFTVSETAARQGIANDPPPYAVQNLKRLAIFLEDVRALLGVPLRITSGYRSPALNVAIGGSPTSAHVHGLAADFIAPPLTVVAACQRIATSMIDFDQLIFEHTWVHFGLSADKARRQVLTLVGKGYMPGIVHD